MLYDESTATIEDQREIVTVLAHELGHQWFGNLVTPAWWNDLWLKEGFANYVKYLAVQQVFLHKMHPFFLNIIYIFLRLIQVGIFRMNTYPMKYTVLSLLIITILHIRLLLMS